MKESLAAKLRAAHYLAVLIDRDSDISNTECEIVYVRLMENGKPINLLVGQQTPEHSHAFVVLNATKATFGAVCPGDDGGGSEIVCLSVQMEPLPTWASVGV
ncbi:zinc finger protein 862-like [Lates japonicus]